MKSDSPDKPPAPTGNETQVIDLSEVELLVAQHSAESARQLEAGAPTSDRSMPPPLPPPLPPQMSTAPIEPPARGNAFYVVAILAFLVIGIGGGLVIAKTLSKPSPAPPDPIHVSGSIAPPSGGVITIPTVEMNDTDAGSK